MADISEYGDIMLNAYLDEWGRKRIDGLLEEGTKILIAGVAPIIRAWFSSVEVIHIFRHPNRTIKLTQFLRLMHTWTVMAPAAVIKQWFANLKLYHILFRPERKVPYPQTLRLTHTFRKPLRIIKIPIFLNLIHTSKRPQRLIKLLQQSRLIHEYYVSKPGIKKTRLFLVIGELAFQLSED